MVYDCFVSYQHEDISFVKKLVYALEARGLVCWYAPRNVSGSYPRAISNGIRYSSVFLLILSARSAVSGAVLNELEMAQNVEKQSHNAVIQPVIIEDLNYDAQENEEVMYYIRRRQFVDAYGDIDINAVADEIIQKNTVLQSDKRSKSSHVILEMEEVRIQKQNAILNYFDREIYESCFAQYSAPAVLDLGCGSGDMLLSRLMESHTDFSIYMGIDDNPRQIEKAKEKHKSPKIDFFVGDLEANDFDGILKRIVTEKGIESFQIVNLSMLLLHLENPEKMLRIVRKYISDEGTLIIRDIDDGTNFAAPDPDGSFDRIYRICERDERSGNRKSGRYVYCDLMHAGFEYVRLEKQGLSSIGMTDEQKETFFQMYFPFTMENARVMYEKYPWKTEIQEDYFWYKDHYNSIHDRFMASDFVFSLGFQTYTARLKK